MSLLSPWALAWVAAAAAIVGLYFLKPRSRRVEVSSIWLWQGALREESARTLIQWLRRHLLLLLQVVVALLAMFALARPALTREQPVGRTVVLGMDVSAAMLANDGDPGAPGLVPGPGAGAPNARFTRLDEARARAVAFLRGPEFRPGDRVIVLGMADRAEVVAQGTLPADLGRLQQALERLGPLPAELDLPQALEVASGLTSSARVGQLVIFSGGVLDPARLTPSPELNVSVVPVGKGEADNQAVTALSARRGAAGDLEVFVRVRNFGEQAVQGTLQLVVDGRSAQPQPVDLPAGGSQPLVLTEFPPSASVIEARFARTDRPDLLLLDNVATAAVAVPPLRKVLLVGGRSEQLERALKAVPGVELTKADPQSYEGPTGGRQGGYDVYVFEGWFPQSPPPGHWVLIDPPARGAPVTVTGTLGRRTDGGRELNDAQIVRVLPSPLLQGVDLTGVGVQEAKKVQLPEWAEEVVAAREAPLLFMGYPRPYRAAVFAFDLRSSNLFGRVGFPVLVANTVNWLTGEGSVGGASTGAAVGADEGRFVPGDALLIQPLPRASRVTIETPAKRRYQFDGNQPVRFVDTAMPGAYTVTQLAGNQEIGRRVHVASVLQPGREESLSDLKPRAELGTVATNTGAPSQPPVLGPGRETTYGEWWRLLGVVALLGLLAEWWWFHR